MRRGEWEEDDGINRRRIRLCSHLWPASKTVNHIATARGEEASAYV
jgi:hypothetical protein